MATRSRPDLPNARDLLDMGGLYDSDNEFSRIVVAVSGGADSMALLCALHEIRASNSMELRVVHANHRTRADSLADEEFVRAFCQELGVEIYTERREPGTSSAELSEAELRSFRYEVYRKALVHFDAGAVVLGHTSDDLVETLLMNLVRGAGLGAYQYHYKSSAEGVTVLRPFWKTSRTALLRYLESRGIRYREDSSNEETAYTRNRIRHVLLPLLEKEFNARVRQSLLKSAEVLGSAQEFISETARCSLERSQILPGSPPAVARHDLLQQPAAVATEMIRQLLVQFMPAGAFITYQKVQECYDALRENRVRVVQLPCGAYAVTGEHLWLSFRTGPANEAPTDIELAVAHCRIFRLPLARLSSSIIVNPQMPLVVPTFNGAVTITSHAVHGEKVLIRNRKPGDRLPGGVKLKDVLLNDKFPYYLRDYLLVTATGSGEVLHVVGVPRVNGRIAAQIGSPAVSVEFNPTSRDDNPCDTGT